MSFKILKRAAGFLCISILSFCIPFHVVHASQTSVDDDETEAVEAFVKDFYEAHTEEKIDSVKEYLDDNEKEFSIANAKALFACGLQKYDNLEVRVRPLSEKGYWLAMVTYDAYFEDFDIGLPGAVTHLIYKQADGKWLVNPSGISDDLMEETRLIIATEDDFVQPMKEQTAKCDNILEKNPEIQEWLTKLDEEVTKLTALYLLEDNLESSDSDVYIVKKGDCLWKIAKRELGDGRCWKQIYEANKSVIGSNPRRIRIGIQLQIPENVMN